MGTCDSSKNTSNLNNSNSSPLYSNQNSKIISYNKQTINSNLNSNLKNSFNSTNLNSSFNNINLIPNINNSFIPIQNDIIIPSIINCNCIICTESNINIKICKQFLCFNCFIPFEMLDQRGDCITGWRINKQNGPPGNLKNFIPPIGWIAIDE